ncbi:MAG TPA: YncE family protein [Rudaea sp.]
MHNIVKARRWTIACATCVIGALTMDSAVALSGGPFAFVPSNSPKANTFSVVNLSSKTAGAPVVVDPDGTITGQTTAFFGVALSPATGMLFLSDDGQTESVFQVDISKIGTASNPAVKRYFVGNNPRGLAVDPSGRHVYVAQFGVDAVSILDTTVNTSQDHTAGIPFVDFANLTNKLNIPAKPFDVKLNLGGTVAYVSDSSINQRVCRFATSPAPASVSDSDCVAVGTDPDSETANPNQLAVSPDGTRVYVVNNSDSSVSVIDTTHVDPTTHKPILQVVRSFKLGFSGPNGIVIHPSGKRAYVGTSGGLILSLDLLLADNNQGATPPNPVVHNLTNANIFGVQGLAISPDATRLLAADFSNSKLHFINIVNAADSYDTSVPVNSGPKSFGQFATPDDRIFVSPFGSTAAGH